MSYKSSSILELEKNLENYTKKNDISNIAHTLVSIGDVYKSEGNVKLGKSYLERKYINTYGYMQKNDETYIQIYKCTKIPTDNMQIQIYIYISAYTHT